MHYVSKEFKESERQKIFGMAAEMQSQGNKRKRETENTRTTKKAHVELSGANFELAHLQLAHIPTADTYCATFA